MTKTNIFQIFSNFSYKITFHLRWILLCPMYFLLYFSFKFLSSWYLIYLTINSLFFLFPDVFSFFLVLTFPSFPWESTCSTSGTESQKLSSLISDSVFFSYYDSNNFSLNLISSSLYSIYSLNSEFSVYNLAINSYDYDLF